MQTRNASSFIMPLEEAMDLLNSDISNKNIKGAKTKVALVMDILTRKNGSVRLNPSEETTQTLLTIVRRIEKIDAESAMKIAAYIEHRVGCANPTPSQLKDAMANKALNIADRLTKNSSSKAVFNSAAQAVKDVRDWNGIEVEMKAEAVMSRIMTRASKAKISLFKK